MELEPSFKGTALTVLKGLHFVLSCSLPSPPCFPAPSHTGQTQHRAGDPQFIPSFRNPREENKQVGVISGCALLSPCGWKALCTQGAHCSLLGLFFLGEGLDDFLLLGLQAFLAALPSLLGFGPASLSLVTARRVCECLGIIPDSQEKAFPAGPALLASLVCPASC